MVRCVSLIAGISGGQGCLDSSFCPSLDFVHSSRMTDGVEHPAV